MTGGQWQMLDMRGPALPERKTLASYGRECGEAVLAPRRIVGREGIGQLFEYRVEAIARASIASGFFDEDERTKIDLDRIAGSPVWLTIDLERQDSLRVSRDRRSITTTSTGAGTRHINGIVASARVLSNDGFEIVYEFVVRPSFSLAALKQDSRFFSGSIVQILEDVISRYGQIEWRIGSSRYPQRDYIRQAWETDWQFFLRLCEEWGFIVWFEHHGREHTLVIADTANACRKHERAYETLRYHSGEGHIDEEHISELTLTSTVTPGVVTVQDHSYIQPHLNRYSVPFRAEYRDPRNTANADQEIFTRADFALPKTRRDAPYDESNWRETAREFARIKLEAIRAEGLRAQAKGALRGIESGKTLTVTHHPHQAANGEYLVIGCKVDICATGTTSSSTREYAVTASFEMRPLGEPYRMPHITPRPIIGGFEYAVIVGPENAEMFVDEYNRALVQFDWDRTGQYDGKSAIWVRLATQWQGNGMGTVTHARCGQQVLVGYMHGDPDRPVIVGFVVDENNRPPWKMPANQALSGMVSKSLGLGTQTNHLALDDTQGQMQAQLASDHGKSSLSIGYITRIDGNTGRQDSRGEGFELRTDQHGGIRAALGLLLTTWGRKLAAGKVKEMGETIGQLTAARDLHESCVAQAQRHDAIDAHADQSDVLSAIKDANARLKGGLANGQNSFPEFEQPDIALSSAANLHTASAGNTHIVSERHSALTAGGHLSIASGKSFFVSVRERLAFYAQKAVTIITPGPVHFQSRNSSLMQSAQDDLSITSTNGIVRIAGKNGVDILCGGTLLRLRPEGLTGYTGGDFLVHAANHGTNDPQPMPVDFPVSPDKPGRFAAHHVLVEDGGGFAVPNQPYRLTLDDGQMISGVTNELGELHLVTSNAVVFGAIELMSQSEPDNVISVTHLTISQDAALPPPAKTEIPARELKVSGQTIKTPTTGATSKGKAPDYLSCDADNFGLRSYRYLNNSKEEPASIHTRNDVEYFIAKPYTAAVKEKLTSIDWHALTDLPFARALPVIASAVSGALEIALGAGPFGLPGSAMPNIISASAEKLEKFNLHPQTTLAVFSADLWAMLIGQPYLERILLTAKKKLEADNENKTEFPVNALQNTLCDLARTVYHEARHCQQTFWIASLYKSYPGDYAQYGGMERMFELVFKREQWNTASHTPFPDDLRVKIGMHRMLVFYYWWRVVYQKDVPGWELIGADFERIQQAVCEMRGVTAEQAALMATHETGYYTHYHEEDAYATENAVDQYWHRPDGAFVLNPGVCTSSYEQNIRNIGVSGNG
ncbi:type VI secretion system Vgr family protein [Burkholderia sp. Ax-1719]|uniref:type VI secretion system Vgr family protein n=1 Tax=Burkholderia sp. Ax-1719 TaxID=2608334 RepID=UPI00141DA3C5|nr:type VI secretion system Vgr family protein [Burkholderia sp. Ax-1719]NIE66301.1 type VI secretion system tip protein VgrG [Burkholderia sp. Ax-1719]